MFKKSKLLVSVIVSITLIIVFSPVSEAHVTVNPSESEPNAYEKYGVRVPVEKDINTTKLTLRIPDGINLISVQPVADWDYDIEKNDNEEIIAVNWVANNGGIGPNEYTEFNFIAVNPADAGDFSWEAIQTYEDGSIVEWIDVPGSAEPASVTSVVVGADDNSSDTSSKSNSTSTPWLPISLAGIAILLALIGLFRKK